MKILLWIGMALTIIGIGGFFTVADDLRHRGELMAVQTILLFGLVSLGVSWRRRKL